MSSAPTADEIARDATWLAQALDAKSGVVRLVKMDAGAYRSASFLDDRMMQQPREAHVVPWREAQAAIGEQARRDARWIFHIGHVGSTLIARLLGELQGVLAIREPRFLRDMAMLVEGRGPFALAAQALFSRTFARGELALVKATSFVSEIADTLVPPGERALLIYASPRNYIASILAGPNSIQELAALAPMRVQRMSGRISLPQPRNDAEAAAAAWACEMTTLESVAGKMEDRLVMWADFDAMLGDVPSELARMSRFFGFGGTDMNAIATGPLMRRYSKATEHEYSPSLRRDLIAEADAAHRGDIDTALAMLQSARANSPLLDAALRRAECTEPSNS